MELNDIQASLWVSFLLKLDPEDVADGMQQLFETAKFAPRPWELKEAILALYRKDPARIDPTVRPLVRAMQNGTQVDVASLLNDPVEAVVPARAASSVNTPNCRSFCVLNGVWYCPQQGRWLEGVPT